MIHIARNGKQEGPYSLEQIQASLQTGSLKPSDMAWWEGCAGWVPVSGIPGLNLAAAPTAAAGLGSVQDIYAAPRSQILPSGSGQVSGEAMQALRETRPWVLFLAILGIIFTGLMLLGGIAMIFGGLAGAASASSSSSSSPGSAFPAAVMIGMSVMYLLFGALYLYPVIKLFKYAGAIGALNRSGTSADLERALRHQKGFWKFLGIMAIIIIIGYIGMIILVGGTIFTSGLRGGHSSGSFAPPPSSVAPSSP